MSKFPKFTITKRFPYEYLGPGGVRLLMLREPNESGSVLFTEPSAYIFFHSPVGQKNFIQNEKKLISYT
jgi:hypothetical protein